MGRSHGRIERELIHDVGGVARDNAGGQSRRETDQIGRGVGGLAVSRPGRRRRRGSGAAMPNRVGDWAARRSVSLVPRSLADDAVTVAARRACRSEAHWSFPPKDAATGSLPAATVNEDKAPIERALQVADLECRPTRCPNQPGQSLFVPQSEGHRSRMVNKASTTARLSRRSTAGYVILRGARSAALSAQLDKDFHHGGTPSGPRPSRRPRSSRLHLHHRRLGQDRRLRADGAGYMAAMGVPGALLPLVILVELGGGILILVGFQTASPRSCSPASA